MNRLVMLALAVVLLVSGCNAKKKSKSKDSDDSPAKTASAAPKVSYEVAATYDKNGQKWQAIVVTSKDDAKGAAKTAFVKDGVFVHVFNDKKTAEKYVDWTTHYPDKAHPSPSPEEQSKHMLGMLRRSIGGAPAWTPGPPLDGNPEEPL